MSHVGQHLVFFDLIVGHHFLVSLSLRTNNLLDRRGSRLSLVHGFVALAVSSFQRAVHRELRDHDVGFEFNLITLLLSL